MSLSNGNYLIRAVPQNVSWPFAGGNYATRNELNSPIIVQTKITTDDSAQVVSVQIPSFPLTCYVRRSLVLIARRLHIVEGRGRFGNSEHV